MVALGGISLALGAHFGAIPVDLGLVLWLIPGDFGPILVHFWGISVDFGCFFRTVSSPGPSVCPTIRMSPSIHPSVRPPTCPVSPLPGADPAVRGSCPALSGPHGAEQALILQPQHLPAPHPRGAPDHDLRCSSEQGHGRGHPPLAWGHPVGTPRWGRSSLGDL